MFSFLDNREKLVFCCVVGLDKKDEIADSVVRTVVDGGLKKQILPDGTFHGRVIQKKYGRASRDRQYRYGKLHGTLLKYWHHTGAKKVPEIEMKFFEGKKHGLEKRWSVYGKLWSERQWEHGTMIKYKKYFIRSRGCTLTLRSSFLRYNLPQTLWNRSVALFLLKFLELSPAVVKEEVRDFRRLSAHSNGREIIFQTFVAFLFGIIKKIPLRYQNKRETTPAFPKRVLEQLDPYLKNMQNVCAFSDCHLEIFPKKLVGFEKGKILKAQKDKILCLCGDIGNPWSKGYVRFLKWCSSSFEFVFVIAGNHEYYGKHSMEDTNKKIGELCGALPNVEFLQNSSFEYGGILFVGATLWTKVPENADEIMNDYSEIPELTAQKVREMHNVSLNFFCKEIGKGQKTVLLSHHCPFKNSETLKCDKEPVASCYGSEVSGIAKENVAAWFWGHTHKAFRRKIGPTLFACNPKGYGSERTGWNAEMNERI
ncbi:putative calcineurin-like phosphoesterase [Port-miou virus]|uniref:Putative calcineurin-like phosphoesterase n=1 Tax=Port-miou virus TaxID=1733873 RepID=A0A0N9PVT7_9VIRU|nr:putative calcineurin-like phosphoesterase [Port-miou virus]